MAASRISVEIVGSSAELQRATVKAADSLKGLGDVLKRQSDVAQVAGDRTVRLNEVVAKSFQSAATQAGVASDRTIRAFERQGAVVLSSSREQQTALQRTGAVATASAGEQVRASERAATAAESAGARQVATAHKMERAFGSASSGMTRSGKMIALGFVGAAAASATLAAKFQANTLRMQTQAGATTGQLAKLRQGILSLSGQVGFAPNKLADALYHVVSSMNAVLPPAQRVKTELQVLKLAAEGATVGHSGLEETTYALASAMNALHAPAGDAQKIMGTLNAIVGAGDMTMSQLVETLSTGVLPAAQGAGVSLQSLGAAMAVMGDMGQQGSMVGTRLRMSIALLSSPSEAAAKILNTLGMNAKEATSTSHAMAEALRKAGLRTTSLSADLHKPDGILVALRDLNSHLRSSGLTATGAAAVMNKAFGGGKMGATIVELAQNTGRLDTKFHQVGNQAGSFGAAWQRASHTTQFELHSLEGSALSLGTRLGTDLLPIVNQGVHDISAFVGWLEKGSPAAHALEEAVGAFATVAVGSYLVANLTKAIKLMRELWGFASSPLGVGGAMGRATRPTAMGAMAGGGGLAGMPTMGYKSGTGPFSVANPGVVMIEAGDIGGLGSRSASGMGTTQSRAVQAERNALGSAAGSVSTGATTAEATAAGGMMASFKSGMNHLLGGLLKGGLIAGVGVTASQLAGSAIGGKTGQDVKGVGTGAAIGAGLGSFLGPEGTLAGGITGALLGAFATFVKRDASKFGDQIAAKVTAPLGKEIAAQYQHGISKDLNKARADASAAVTARSVGAPGVSPRAGALLHAGAIDAAGLSKQSQAAFFNAGYLAAQATVRGLQSVKTPTTYVVTRDILHQLQALPAQARPEAAKVMLQYAAGLQQNGRLPKGAVDQMIGSIRRTFPGLQNFLQQQGLQSDATIAKALQFTGAQASLTGFLANVRDQYGIWTMDTKITGQNIWQNTATAMNNVQAVVSTTAGHTRAVAEAQYQQLQHHVAQYFATMTGDISASADDMRKAVSQGSQRAYQVGAQNFGKLQQSIGGAMSAGVMSVQQGTNLIATALNNTLKAFGEKPLGLTTIQNASPAQLQAVASGAVSSGGLASPHATGGYIGNRGEKGRDTVPAILGRGEAVLKGQDQAMVNRGLQVAASVGFPVGSIDGVFAANAGQKHYMASGGYAGYSLPLPRGAMMPGSWSIDQGVDIPAPAGTPEFAIGPGVITGEGISGFGPNAPILRITAGPLAGRSVYYGHAGPDLVKVGQTVRAGQQISEVGAGRVGISSGPHIEFGYWPSSGGAIMANTLRQLMGGAGVTGIGGAGGAPTIGAPKVSGSGTIASIARGALGKETAAANAYLAKTIPTVGAATVGGQAAGTPAALAGWLTQAMSIAGVSGPLWLAMLERQAMRESGGRPGAVNKTDINAQRGDPSEGLLQTTLSTFASFAIPGHDNITNPVDNAIAAIRYMIATYGGGNPDRAAQVMWARGGGAYAGGGFVHAARGLKPKTIKAPKHKPVKVKVGKAPHGIGTGMTAKDLQALSRVGGQVNTLETAIAKVSGRYQADQTLFGPQEGSAQYLNPDGSLNPAGYAKKISDDQALLGLDQYLLALYQDEVPIVSGALKHWLGDQRKENSTIARNKKRLASNKIREASIRKAILDLQKPSKDRVGAIQGSIAQTRLSYGKGIETAQKAQAAHRDSILPRWEQLEQALLNADGGKLGYHGDAHARALRSAVIAAKQAKAAYHGGSHATKTQLSDAVHGAENAYSQYLLGQQPVKSSLSRKSTAAGLALRQFMASDKPAEQALADAITGARFAERDALQPLQQAELDAKRAQRDRKFSIASKIFGFRQDLARLGRDDLRLTQNDTALAGVLSGADGGQSTNATVNLLETIAGKLGMLNWTGGNFAGIDTTMPGAIVSVQADMQTLRNDIGQAQTGQNTPVNQDSQLVQILQAENLQLAQSLALNQAQTSVLRGMIPEIPRYESGGPVLQDTLAMVHGGEHVVPKDGALVMRERPNNTGNNTATMELHQHYHGSAGALMSLIDQRIAHPDNIRMVSRGIGQRTSMLAGAPGGGRRF